MHYPDDYPDVLPEFSLKPIDGDIMDNEIEDLLQSTKTVASRAPFILRNESLTNNGFHKQGEENLGMAMTFTLVSHLRERLSILIRDREEHRKQEEREKERLALEVSYFSSYNRLCCG